MYDEKALKQFDRWGVARPTSDPHGTEEDIIKNMKRAKCWNWHMTAPGVLKCDTEIGPLTQTIDNNFICEGTNEHGMPILTRIKA